MKNETIFYTKLRLLTGIFFLLVLIWKPPNKKTPPGLKPPNKETPLGGGGFLRSIWMR